MAGSALRRLMAEYKRKSEYIPPKKNRLESIVRFLELTLNPPEGIIAGPINEENFFEWEALIT